jgi:diguanylate cyclase (GGDEF)-like protein
MNETLVVIDTESSVCQLLGSRLRILNEHYALAEIIPNVTLGEVAMIDAVKDRVDSLLKSHCTIAAVFVDLVVHEDAAVYSHATKKSYDNLGLRIALTLHLTWPALPVFIITGKITSRAEESLISEASVEDIDGILTKDYLYTISSERLHRILSQGALKRSIALGVGAESGNREMEQKFGIVFSLRQADRDIAFWRRGLDGESFGFSVGVLFLDIDDFKILNTRFTESVVDQTILPAFQQLLVMSCMHRGAAYRFGGEEFVVLLPNCDDSASMLFAERLRRMVELAEFEVQDQTVRVTISIGVSVWTSQTTLKDVIELANRAEHQSKQTGKNRTTSDSVLSTKAY